MADKGIDEFFDPCFLIAELISPVAVVKAKQHSDGSSYQAECAKIKKLLRPDKPGK